MIGYKATNQLMQCRGYQYEVGKNHIYQGIVFPCKTGFHFCDSLEETMRHYPYNSRLFKVESGDITYKHTLNQFGVVVTNELKFKREIDYMSLLKNTSDPRLFECALYNILLNCNNDTHIIRKLNSIILNLKYNRGFIPNIVQLTFETGYIYSKRVGLVHHTNVSDDKIIKMFHKSGIDKMISNGFRIDLFIKDKRFHEELAKHGYYLDKLKHSNDPNVLMYVAKHGITDIKLVENGNHKYMKHQMDRILRYLVQYTNKYDKLITKYHVSTIKYLINSNRIEEFFDKNEIVSMLKSFDQIFINTPYKQIYIDSPKDHYNIMVYCDDIDILKQIAEKADDVDVIKAITKYGIVCKNDKRYKREIDEDLSTYPELRFLPFSLYKIATNKLGHNIKPDFYNFLMKQKDIKIIDKF